MPAREKKEKQGSGRRTRVKSGNKTGKYSGSALPKGPVTDIALDATIRAAAPKQAGREKNGTALAIEKSDLREKVRRRMVGNTIVFVVDSSGSMGAARRMTETKGAVLSLLVEAYQKRDRVALVAFKGDRAEVLLQPTSSVELAQKQLDVLPTGGKTPLALGIVTGLDLIRRQLAKDPKIKPLLVLISDGRSNVAMNAGADPSAQALDAARAVREAGVQSLVIDTESGFIRLSMLRDIARESGGHYAALEDIRAEGITGLVKESLARG